MNARSLSLLRLVVLPMMTWSALRAIPFCRSNEFEEVQDFVRAVLATADRDELGLPEEPTFQMVPYVANGHLPTDLQRYLERLVSASSAVDGRKLVTMLWDDSFVIDEDQEPHEVFEEYRRKNGPVTDVEPVGTSNVFR